MKAKPLPTTGSLGAWVLAARPKTLVAGWAPVLVGSAMTIGGGDSFRYARGVAALIVAMGIQVGTNLVNDAADSERGADAAGRLGPPRAVAEGLLSGRSAMKGGLACFGIAGFAGLWLASVAGWWLLIPGGIAIIAGIAYTAGPKPLAYLGLGEVFVFVFFGLFATAGSAYVQFVGTAVTQRAEWAYALALGAALGLLSVAILEVNNIRDAPTDVHVGKATFAVRIGDRAARSLFVFCVAGAFSVTAVAGWLAAGGDRRGLALVLLPLLAVPLAIKPVQAVRSGTSGRDLNPVLGETARLEAIFALLIAVSFVAYVLLPPG